MAQPWMFMMMMMMMMIMMMIWSVTSRTFVEQENISNKMVEARNTRAA
jgi:ABC-type xylose transport system permease subunit